MADKLNVKYQLIKAKINCDQIKTFLRVFKNGN